MIITKDNPFYWKDPRSEKAKQQRIEPKTLIEKYKRIKLRSSLNLTKREEIVKKAYRNKDWMVLFQYLEQEIKPFIRNNFDGEDAEVVKQLFQRLYNFGSITI
jgi:hypothetical protein